MANDPVEIAETRGKIIASFKGIAHANQVLGTSNPSFIQKRGFNYSGDTQGWGLRGGSGGLGGGAGFNFGNDFGRGISQIGFSLQPFGIGTSGFLGTSITPSIFAWTGSNARFSEHTKIARLKMALAVEAYKGFGIVKNVIDLMCNFASEGLTISHPSKSIEKFYRRWADLVDLQGRCKDGLRQYYKTSNVFVYRTMADIDEMTYRRMKNSKAEVKDSDLVDSNDPALKRRKEQLVESKQIPWRYTFLNPFQMDVRGSKYFGNYEWVFLLDEKTKQRLEDNKNSPEDVMDETKINLPVEFQKMEKDGMVVLDQANLYTLHYMKDDHEDWADPMIWPVMNDIMYKNQLRAMDMSVANSVIAAITIFKLGDIKSGYVPPKEHFIKFSEMLRTPTYGQNLVWNDAISIESNYPPIEKILNIEKYRSVDRDIMAGLGVPSILLDGAEGGSFSNAFLQVRALLERLEEGRREIIKWIENELRTIANVMGHRDIPVVKFGQMSLRDENAEKQLIIQLLDRNIISAHRVHEVFDIETNIELERMREEKDLSENEDLMVKFGPFKDPMNTMDTEDTMNLDTNNKIKIETKKAKIAPKPAGGFPSKQGKNVTKPNGRPSGIKTPLSKKRVATPKGMADLNIVGMRVCGAVEATVTDLMVKARGVKNIKGLTSKDKDDIAEMSFYAAMAIAPSDMLTAANIEAAIQSPNFSLQSSFEESRLLQSLDEQRQFRIATYAMYYGETDEEDEEED